MKGDSLKLRQERCGLDVWRNFSTERVMGHWNGLPGRRMESRSLEVFKETLYGALIPWSVRSQVGLDERTGLFQSHGWCASHPLHYSVPRPA